jgi:cysteine desulfurase
MGAASYSPSMVYLDNAASTRPAPEVLAATRAVEEAFFANPSSAHGLGAAAARAVEAARAEVAAALGAEPSEVVFTGGGTEANALGLLGVAHASRGRHLVVSGIEHPAVARSAERLVAEGYEISVVPPTPAGVVRAADIAAATRADTAVVALMLVNNELGTLQPVAEVARALAAARPQGGRPGGRGPHLHVDAVQAFGFLRVRPHALGADTLCISGHKVHGPKGIGALWVRAGVRLTPLWDGGRQERGLRSGTENVAGCVGLGRAAALAVEAQDAGLPAAIERLRDRLEREILDAIPDARPTVADAPRAPHISSLAFPGFPAEPLLHALEARDVYASAGSACASRTRGPSAVLKAIGVDDRTAVLRFSLARTTMPADVDAAVEALRGAIEEISPLANVPARR